MQFVHWSYVGSENKSHLPFVGHCPFPCSRMPTESLVPWMELQHFSFIFTLVTSLQWHLSKLSLNFLRLTRKSLYHHMTALWSSICTQSSRSSEAQWFQPCSAPVGLTCSSLVKVAWLPLYQIQCQESSMKQLSVSLNFDLIQYNTGK